MLVYLALVRVGHRGGSRPEFLASCSMAMASKSNLNHLVAKTDPLAISIYQYHIRNRHRGRDRDSVGLYIY